MRKFNFVIIIIITIFSGCLKQQSLKEVDNQRIISFILETGLNFDTTKNGIIYFQSYEGEGQKLNTNSQIFLLYDAFYIDKAKQKIFFAQSDTVFLNLNDRDLINGWTEVLSLFADGGSGIAIFPFDKAYSSNQVPQVPANTTLYFYFRILSESYRINQTSLFWEYARDYDSLVTIVVDSLLYYKYFDGIGDIVDENNCNIEINIRNINDSLIKYYDNYFLSNSDINFSNHLKNAIFLMYEGEMGTIVTPPTLGYTSDNFFNIKPFSTLLFQVRILSENPEVSERSNIDKYLFFNTKKIDSLLPSGIYYYVNNKGGDLEVNLNSTITYTDSIFILNNNNCLEFCDNCNQVVNATNFKNGFLQSILLMKNGEKATFIIPYSLAYGSLGHGNIPPYATILYKVYIKKVE
jgi:FKBP-type peptidyl-prolyl cis-trans isomerase